MLDGLLDMGGGDVLGRIVNMSILRGWNCGASNSMAYEVVCVNMYSIFLGVCRMMGKWSKLGCCVLVWHCSWFS